MVPPTHFDWFEGQLAIIGVKKDVVIEDVFKYLKEKEEGLLNSSRNVGNRSFTFDAYYRFDEIYQYLRELTAANSQRMEIVVNGTTHENRDLFYIKISTDRFVDTTKPIIVIEAGIAAREWITIPAAINIIQQLLLPGNINLLNQVNWIIVPVLNPDGYEYSYSNLRNWKKNRNVSPSLGDLIMCVGVNINRNFDIAHGGIGSSSSPCSHEFAGKNAFSEKESLVIKSILSQYRRHISMYLSIQNQGPLVSFPWRFEHAASAMFRPHLLFGRELHRQLNLVNEPLDIASLAFGGRASGTSADYMQEEGVIYSLNLGVRQTGRDGFIIPESDIRNHINPIWDAIQFAATYTLRSTINV